MNSIRTALRRWLAVPVLWLAVFCPLPVLAAGSGAALPVSVITDGTDAQTLYTVNLTPLENAPAPAQTSLTVKNGGTVYFTGFAFDAPGDYRYRITQTCGTAAHTAYDAHSYTVTIRVTSRADGGLNTEYWAVRGGDAAKAADIRFINRYEPPAAVQTAAVRPVKAAAAPAARSVPTALPQTADSFPLEALLAMLCAGVVGFGTAWTKRK